MHDEDVLFGICLLVVLPIAIVLTVNLCNYFVQRQRIGLLKKALEVDGVTPELIDKLLPQQKKLPERDGSGLFTVSLVLIGLGIALSVLLKSAYSWGHASYGLFLLLPGIGLLISYFFLFGKNKND